MKKNSFKQFSHIIRQSLGSRATKMTGQKRLLDEYLSRSNLYNNYFATLNSVNGPFGSLGGDIGGYAGQGNYGRFY